MADNCNRCGKVISHCTYNCNDGFCYNCTGKGKYDYIDETIENNGDSHGIGENDWRKALTKNNQETIQEDSNYKFTCKSPDTSLSLNIDKVNGGSNEKANNI